MRPRAGVDLRQLSDRLAEMIDSQDAVALAEHELAKMAPPDGDSFERSFGWVLFWGSAPCAKTGDLQYALAGNAPFIVN
jgi:hypothetical protein